MMKAGLGEFAMMLAAILPLAPVAAGAAQAQEVKRTEIGRTPVSGDDSKEIIVQIVEAPPGAISERHYHNGEEFYYVLEGGKIQMPGKEPQERPAGAHGVNLREVPHAGYKVVGDKTIKTLSFYVVDKGKPLQVPAP